MMIERRCEIDHLLSIYEISTDKGLMVKVQTCGFATIFHECFFGARSRKINHQNQVVTFLPHLIKGFSRFDVN